MRGLFNVEDLMAKANFSACLAHVLASEGGYVDHPKDPGGATNMGITLETLSLWRGQPVSKTDVKLLQREEAAAIYRKHYWDEVRGDDLPVGLDLVAFDAAVNSGVYRGGKWLQQAIGSIPDGIIGPRSLAVAKTIVIPQAVTRAIRARKNFLLSLSTWPIFGTGWSKRLASVEAAALKMAKGT